MIKNRTIYVSNNASVQVGSFESNLDKWDLLISGTLFNGNNLTADYFIGDGSLLTNVPAGSTNILTSADSYKQLILTNTFLQYWDGVRNRLDISTVHTKFYSPDGSYTLLDNNQYVYNDGTRNRLEINSNGFMGVSPNGAETIILSNDGLLYNMVEIATVNDINPNWDTAYGWGNHDGLYSLLNHKEDSLYSPDGLKNLTLDNTNFIYNDGTWNRFGITEITTILVSPDGTENLQISNNGVLYNDIEVATINNLHNESRIVSPDTLNNLTVNNSGAYLNGYFTFGDDLIYNRDNLYLIFNSPGKNHNLVVGNDAVTVDGWQIFTAANTLSQISDVTDTMSDGDILVWNATSEEWENSTIAAAEPYDNMPGTVIASVTWNANTVSSGEATGGYRTNHLRAFRLAPGIWSIENMGTNPLIPGDSADWVTNSLRGGISNPFFIAELTINAFGQPAVGHPVTMEISATSTGTSPNTGNLGSVILKIKDKDGVVSDPTLADAYATVKFTYIE